MRPPRVLVFSSLFPSVVRPRHGIFVETRLRHLIHDYAAFAGETPARLLASEGELSSYFSSPQRLAALFDGRRYA